MIVIVYFDLQTRFSDVEYDVVALENDSFGVDNAAAIAAAIVGYQSADTALDNKITAEVNARTTAVQDLQTEVDQNKVDAAAASAAVQVNVDSLTNSSAAARTATLQGNIDTVSGQVGAIVEFTAEDLNTLQDFKSYIDQADTDASALIAANHAALLAKIEVLLEAQMAELTNE